MYIDLVAGGVVIYIYIYTYIYTYIYIYVYIYINDVMGGQLRARQDTEENSHELLQTIWKLLYKYTDETHGKPYKNLNLFSE